MNGFRSQLIEKIVGINGHIILYFNDETVKNLDAIEQISSIQSIESVSEEVEMHAMITSEKNSQDFSKFKQS